MAELGAVLGQLKQERSRLQAELRQLEQAIRALTKVAGRDPRTGKARRTFSAAARKRIAAAQKARWAKYRSGPGKNAA
ncbi:MAG: hypothetical protein LAO09_18935 [Acidobacteriia bacterium]|nr:hypothetical protein [Terriglobia bacterium]